MIDGVKDNKDFLTNKEFIAKHHTDISDLEQEIIETTDNISEMKKDNQYTTGEEKWKLNKEIMTKNKDIKIMKDRLKKEEELLKEEEEIYQDLKDRGLENEPHISETDIKDEDRSIGNKSKEQDTNNSQSGIMKKDVKEKDLVEKSDLEPPIKQEDKTIDESINKKRRNKG